MRRHFYYFRILVNMIYFIIDIETTCQNDQQPMEPIELIEIGCMVLTKKYEKITEIQAFVKPRVNPELTPFCRQLTTISQHDVDNAPGARSVLTSLQHQIRQILQHKKERGAYLCSWGDYDRRILQEEFKRYGIHYPFADPHINLKAHYARLKHIKPCPLNSALKREGIYFQGTPHRGIDDARMITEIIVKQNLFDSIF